MDEDLTKDLPPKNTAPTLERVVEMLTALTSQVSDLHKAVQGLEVETREGFRRLDRRLLNFQTETHERYGDLERRVTELERPEA